RCCALPVCGFGEGDRLVTKISAPVCPAQAFPELMRSCTLVLIQLCRPVDVTDFATSSTGNASLPCVASRPWASALLRVACLRIWGGRPSGRPSGTKISAPVCPAQAFPELRRSRTLVLIQLCRPVDVTDFATSSTGNTSLPCVASRPCGVCVVARCLFADLGRATVW